MERERGLRIFGGFAVGIANGLFGGGGGMIAVPVLRSAGRPPQAAHATAIAVVLPACAVSGIVYLLHGFVPLGLFLPAALGVLAGGIAGAKLLRSLPSRAVTLLFGAVMLAAGLRMLF